MSDDTLINPDDIGSAEELRDLLMGLGFARVYLNGTMTAIAHERARWW